MLRETKLLDALDEFAGKDPIVHALALSYGYDGDVAYERLWRLLVEKFGVRHPFVIADGALDDTGGYHYNAGTPLAIRPVRPRRSGRGVFHPKLLLAVKEGGVLVTVGSANLTAGGLGGNLELVSALRFVSEEAPAAPKRVLSSILAFLQSEVRKSISHLPLSTLAIFDDILRHAVLAAERVPDGPKMDMAFLHSGTGPLWEALLARHGDDPIERLVVVSPFFEREDPDCVDPYASDGMIGRALGDGTPWAERSGERLDLYAGAIDSAVCVLPSLALQHHRNEVSLHKQLFSVEPRQLHGKLVALLGRERVSLMWGSPNFTPSALLRRWTPGDTTGSGVTGGNAECALAVTLPRSAFSLDQLRGHYGLDRLFARHEGDLPDVPVTPLPPLPAFEVGELLYDPATHGLAFHGEVLDARVRRLVIEPADPAAGLEMKLVVEVTGVGTIEASFSCASLEETDPTTHLRRLRTHEFRIVALDDEGRTIATARIRLNVRFVDALEVLDNILIGPGALTADVLLVPSNAPPEQRVAAVRAFLQRLRDAHASGTGDAFRHHASLDLFYRNVRRGLDARFRGLEAQRGARFALMRWSRDLQRALAAAETEEAARRAYLIERTSEHIERVLDALPGWHEDSAAIAPVLDPIDLATALRTLTLESGAIGPLMDAVVATRERVASRLERGGVT